MEEANACDNGSSECWGWLAYVCMCAEDRAKGLKRDREAAAALEQALREVRLCVFSCFSARRGCVGARFTSPAHTHTHTHTHTQHKIIARRRV